jgi:hypothetical protein
MKDTFFSESPSLTNTSGILSKPATLKHLNAFKLVGTEARNKKITKQELIFVFS